MVTPAPLVARGILRLFADAALAGQKKAFGHDGSLLGSRGAAPHRLGAQMLAALGATTAQDGAAAGGGHAGAETVGAGSSDFTGLVCSLHCSSSLRVAAATDSRPGGPARVLRDISGKACPCPQHCRCTGYALQPVNLKGLHTRHKARRQGLFPIPGRDNEQKTPAGPLPACRQRRLRLDRMCLRRHNFSSIIIKETACPRQNTCCPRRPPAPA